jgi:5-(aminomethyl)-3-furanmethanol phosphate kinase
MSRPIVVVKVGGSLLDWPELPARLTGYLEARRGDRLVLVVGGGRFADILRDLDASHEIGEESSHALALRVLDLTAHLLAKLVPGTRVVEEVSGLDDAWSSSDLPILAPRRFLEADDRSPDPLPHAWTTTTDAIAARLAVRLEADELVLLKSVSSPLGVNLEVAARLGLVDPEFPRAAEAIPILTFRNLREVSESRLNGRGHRPT